MAAFAPHEAPQAARVTDSMTKTGGTHLEVVELSSAGSSPPSSTSISKASSIADDSEALECASLSSSDTSTAALDIDLSATHLISSPYDDPANQLTLHDLELPSRLFAFALTILKPLREDYATAPYLESFNWPEVFALLRDVCTLSGYEWKECSFYTVIFRSVLLPDIDRHRLGLLDQMSHQEACASGGLLKYWFGSCDAELRNLATCLWRSREDAAAGGAGPWHAQARLAARTMYKSISFHTHKLVIEDGATSWRLDEHIEQRPRH